MKNLITYFILTLFLFSILLESVSTESFVANEKNYLVNSKHSFPNEFFRQSETHLEVKLLREEIRLIPYHNITDLECGTINRLISINGVEVMISGHPIGLNYTWKDAHGEPKQFRAIWIHMTSWLYQLPVAEKYFYSRLVFAVDYNGTHFSEAIIAGSSSVGGCGKSFGNFNTSLIYSTYPEVVYLEYNRTEIYGNNSDSPYNPSRALLSVHKYMSDRNYTYDNVTTIFLIPRPFLNATYKDYAFIWYMIFIKDLTEPGAQNATIMYYQLILSPNGSVLDTIREELIEMEPAPICCSSNESNNSWLSGNELYLASILGVIVIIAIFSVQKIRKKSRKEAPKLSSNT